MVLNCDVLFHPVLLLDLLSSRHPDALLMAYHPPNQAPLGDEEMKVKVRRGRVVDMSKTMDPAEADGENVGIVKFSASGASSLVEIMDGLVEAGDVKAWAPRAFLEFSRTTPLFALGTRGFPWIEIDFPEDYRRAIREISPSSMPTVSRTMATATGRPALCRHSVRRMPDEIRHAVEPHVDRP